MVILIITTAQLYKEIDEQKSMAENLVRINADLNRILGKLGLTALK